ncbi:hypothetical protein GO755_26795 [Spirosoma sp. HMF4905]|uniref:Uncharacterized protein n=1 Tax=Spirosoma arboris TaxID=2682092 RepID=A0A7K1SJC3_9BACT|nr:hypothetical protein [Spirosoma arboris]MVM33676.1 hypothetical protein [Spirosoma arboris]
MKVPPAQKEPPLCSGIMPDTVFKNWMIAVALLLQNYRQLRNLQARYYLELHLPMAHSAGIGQCSLRELQRLINLFESEIEALLKDMNKSGKQRPLTLSESHNQVIAHTQRLHQLNYQAQLRLQVADQSAS